MSEEQLALWNRRGYAVHLVTQRGQPYGSVRRCCEICGVMVWPERQGDDTPMYVTSDEDYALMENQCCDRFQKDIATPNARLQQRIWRREAAENTSAGRHCSASFSLGGIFVDDNAPVTDTKQLCSRY